MSNEAEKRYRKKQTEKRGMVKVGVWVPKEHRDNLLKAAKQLRRLQGKGAQVTVTQSG